MIFLQLERMIKRVLAAFYRIVRVSGGNPKIQGSDAPMHVIAPTL
jgi:hypothetical protein